MDSSSFGEFLKYCIEMNRYRNPKSEMKHSHQRRRIYTEENAKVVAAVWGQNLLNSFAALAILHQDDMTKRTNCNRMIMI